MLDYRVAEPDDLVPLGRILADAFAFPVEDAAPWLEKSGMENARVIKRGADVIGGCLLLPFGQTFGGRSVPMGGVAAVGVRVQDRGAGAASALMRGVVGECRERGLPISTLYASNQPLYRRAGYEQAGSRFQARFDAAALPNLHRDGWTVEEVPPADPRVRTLYEVHGRRRAGALARVGYLWRRIEEPRGSMWARGFVVTSPSGRPGGYVWLRAIKDDAPGFYTIHVLDAVADGPGAWRAIWSVIREHATMARKFLFNTSPYDPLFRAIPHPFGVMELQENWMLRICDVPGALRARGYPPGLEGWFGLEVKDDVGGAGGQWQIHVADGRATVVEGGDADVVVDIRGLASWYTGFAHADDLRTRGEISGDLGVISALGACFAGPAPWMRDMF